MSNSQHALKGIAQGHAIGSKQAQIAKIAKLIEQLDTKNVHVVFKWIPAHTKVEGNERADQAAKEAACRIGGPSRTKQERQREVEGLIRLIHNDIDNNSSKPPNPKTPGQYTWRIDKALLGKHAIGLYGALTSEQIAILIQARTGYYRLNRSLFTKGLKESA